MSNSTTLSIIIPVYNSEQYLDKCITSIQNQSLKDIEIILINDGSKDKSLDICEKFAQNDNRIIVINQENSGQTWCDCSRHTGRQSLCRPVAARSTAPATTARSALS